MSLIQRFFSRQAPETDSARRAWAGIIGIAREPQWYTLCKVADTREGRFDMLTIVLSLFMLRLERDPQLIDFSIPLTELFIEDMEGQLRQSGVGDLVIGKRIGELMQVLGGRCAALRAVLCAANISMSGDHEVNPGHAGPSPHLEQVLSRNVTMLPGHSDPAPLTAAVRTLWTTLSATSAQHIMTARIAR